MAAGDIIPDPDTGAAVPSTTIAPGQIIPEDDTSSGATSAPGAVGSGILGGIPFAKDIASAAVPALKKGLSYLPLNADQQKSLAGLPDDYTTARSRLDQAQGQAYQAHPYVYNAATIAPMLMAPVAGPTEAIASRVAPYVGKTTAGILGGAGTAGMYGTMAGASEGDSLDARAQNALKTGTVSSLGGAAAVPAGQLVGRAIGAVTRPISRYFNPSGAATDLIRSTGVGDAANPAMSEADFAAAQAQQGKPGAAPVVLGDLGGQQTRDLARTAANISPAAREALTAPLNARYASQSTRFGDYVSSLFGGNLDSQVTRDTLAANAKATNNPAYQQAYAQGANGVWTPRLNQLLQSDTIQKAIPTAQRFADDYAATNGLPKPAPAFTQMNGTWVPSPAPGGGTQLPSLQFWDHVQRALGSQADIAQRAGDNTTAASIGGLRSAMMGELDSAVPAYATARQGAYQAFNAQDALEAGEQYLKTNDPVALDAQNQALQTMSPADRQIFSRGMARSMIARAQNPADTRNLVGQFNNETMRQKFQNGLDAPQGPWNQGPKISDQVQAYLEREDAMNKLRARVVGGSDTAPKAADMAHAGHSIVGQLTGGLGPIGGGALTGALAAKEIPGLDSPTGALIGAGAGMLKNLYSSMATTGSEAMYRSVAEQLASSDPAVVSNALKRVAARPQLMSALRAVNASIPVISNPAAQQ